MRKLVRIFITLIALVVAVAPVSAQTPSDDILDMFDKNGIYYYNPAGSNDDCNNSSTTLSGNDTAEKIWNFFIQQGFNDAQTAGLLGNGMAESGLGPTRSSNGNYWGLFQWGGGRRVSLQKKVEEAGLGQYLSSEYWASGADKKIPEADFDKLLQIELEHTMSEKDLNWQEEIKKTNSPQEAAEIFLVLFERAVGGDSPIEYYSPYAGQLYQGTKHRRDFAQEYFEKYAGKGVSVTNGSATEETGADITIIGDSITEGSKDALLSKFSDLSTGDINARVSRPWSEGVQIIKNSQNVLKKNVVFALGTNSPNLSAAEINEVVNLLGAEHNIIFVTNYSGDNTTYDSNNNHFKELAKNNSNIFIADWASTVKQSPSVYLTDDNIHPNQAGSELFAEVIYKAINSNTNANGCSVSGEFQSLVLGYAWPTYHRAPWHDRMPDYAQAVTQSLSEGRYVGGSVAGVPGIDCGGFVTILVQNSGIEPEYNNSKGGTDTQEAWVKAHNWQLLNASTNTRVDTSILQPGDVAFSSGHTFIYVGEIDGFDSVIASASYSTSGRGRAPMAGKEDLLFGNGAIVRWYRNPDFNPYETTNSVTNIVTGNVSTTIPSGAQKLADHHVTFYSASGSENGGYAGKNASGYNNGELAPGQAASSHLDFGTVVYVQTQSSGEASYAHGKYFLITDTGAGKIDGDYVLDIFHDVAHPSDNNKAPYGYSDNAQIYVVETGVSWSTFKAKYGW